VYLLFGVFLGSVNPPITNTAVAGMPRSMAAVAAALASAGRQTGTTLGVAISGALIGPAQAAGGMAFTSVARAGWWMVLALGLGIVALGLVSTGRWAAKTARQRWLRDSEFSTRWRDRGRGTARHRVHYGHWSDSSHAVFQPKWRG
jgi:hypothetical protein